MQLAEQQVLQRPIDKGSGSMQLRGRRRRRLAQLPASYPHHRRDDLDAPRGAEAGGHLTELPSAAAPAGVLHSSSSGVRHHHRQSPPAMASVPAARAV